MANKNKYIKKIDAVRRSIIYAWVLQKFLETLKRK
jgi:hypothetical protein